MIRKTLSCLLILLLLVNSLNLSNLLDFQFANKVSAEEPIEIPMEIAKVKELIELREPNSKTFLNSDGSYTTDIFTEDIHYEDAQELKQISNTPVVNDENDKKDYKFKNKDNKFKVKFAASTSKKNLITMKFGEEKIVLKLLDSNLSNANFNDGKVVYKEIFDDVDFEYSLMSSGIKEDIFLKSTDATREFQFKITGTLTPKKEDRYINFYNKKDELVWFMAPPFMEDQNGKYSEEIKFDIKESKGGYILTIIPDDKFLDEKDTVYPVRIDPTTSIGGGASNTDDTYVMEKYANYNYYSTPELRTGYGSSVGKTRSYLDFSQSLPNLSGKILTKAELKVYQWDNIGSASSSNKVFVNRVTQDWNNQTVTYSSQPTFDSSKNHGLTGSNGSAKWLNLNVTDLVNGWVKGTYKNYGVVLRSASEGSAGTYQKFNASESSSNRPYLSITYANAPNAPNVTGYSNSNSTGYVDLSWPAVSGATGYKVLIFNGRSYEEFDVKNATSWSTKGKKLWPTNAQIDSKQYGLRKNSDGQELPENPNYLYKKGGGDYTTRTNYWFRIKAYNNYGTTAQSDAAMPSIPDKTKPTVPTGVQISNNRVGSYTIGWQASNDINGSGVAKYKVYIGDNSSTPNIVNGKETTSNSFTFTDALTPRKTYYAWVQAVDNSSNISNSSTVSSGIARTDFDAQITSYSMPSSVDVDDSDGVEFWFDVKNEGTSSWTNDLNVNLALTSKIPDGSSPQPFASSLATGEVIKPGQTKRFALTWIPKKAVIGDYELKAVVSKGTNPVIINPASNVINKSINVNDIKPPTGNIIIEDGAFYTTVSKVDVKVYDVFDNANGIKKFQIANGPVNADVSNLSFTSPMEVPQSEEIVSWNLSEEGTNYVYAQFTDVSGNVSPLYVDSIIYDSTLPTIELTNIEAGDYVTGTKEIFGTITDEALHEYILEYRNIADETGAWKTISNSTSAITNSALAEWDVNSLPTGEYEVRITATDKAGQTNMLSRIIWIDNVEQNWYGLEDYFPLSSVVVSKGTGFVNLNNGSLIIQDVDFSLSSRAFPLEIGRTYSSNNGRDGLLGKGWVSNYDENLELSEDVVRYIDSDGSIHAFNKLANGDYSIPEGTSYFLSLNQNGYTLSSKDGSLLTKNFNLEGKLKDLTDTNGNQLTIGYDSGKINKVTSFNKSMSFQYNENNLLSQVDFSTGETVSYTYKDGYLSEVILYTKGDKISNHTKYDYKNDKLIAVIAENDLRVDFNYNGNRLIQTKSNISTRKVNADGTRPIVDYNSIQDHFSYDLTDRKILFTTNSLDTDNTRKNLANTEFELNEQGNLAKQFLIRTYTENEDPNIAKQDKDNILITTKYEKNRLKETTDGKSKLTKYNYDQYGNILDITLPAVESNGSTATHTLRYQYNDSLQITHAYNTENNLKQYEYDNKGNLKKEIDEDKNYESYEYDSHGNVIKKLSQRGPLYGYIPDYSMESDSLQDWTIKGTVKKVQTKVKSGIKSIEITPSSAVTTKKIAIKSGRLPVLALIDGSTDSGSSNIEVKLQFLNGSTILKEHTTSGSISTSWKSFRTEGDVPTNATHLQIQVKNIGSSKLYVDNLEIEETSLESKYQYDATGEFLEKVITAYGTETKYTYNEYGQTLKETNSLGQTTENIYNEEQQLIKQIDQAGVITQYEHDLMGNVTKEINELGQITSYEYNKWGQILTQKLPTVSVSTYKDETVNSVKQQKPEIFYEYDELGRKIKETDLNGNILSQEFDGYGRTSKIIDPMQNQKVLGYDNNDNITITKDFAARDSLDGDGKVLVPQGETYATYDDWNRQLTETDNTGNRNVIVATNKYDSENRLTHTKDAEGTEFFYDYNVLGENIYLKDNSNPTVETWTYYDGLGTPAITMSGSAINFNVTDANDNLVESVDFKGTKTTYEYNIAGDKVKQTNPDGSSTQWTYNTNGQIKTETKRVEDTDKATTNLTTTYAYNNAGEVEKLSIDAKVYDKSTKKTAEIKVNKTDVTYDELGRVIREYITYFEGDNTKHADTRFLYDLNGNLLKKWVYDESSDTVIPGDSIYPFVRSESTYEYDANNRFKREEKTENGMVTVKTYKDDENAEVVQSAIGTTTVYYNENDLAKKIITPLNEEINIAYTASELIDKVNGPRLTADMSYGPNEKMTEIKTKKKDSETVIFAESYIYNKQEQIESATNDQEGKKTYTYTQEGFLKTEKTGPDTLTYSYDSNGNLLKTVKQDGTVLVENTYNEGNRIASSIQMDKETNKYVKKIYTFDADGALAKETISQQVSTYTAAKTATIDLVKTYKYAGESLLTGVTTKRGSTVVEEISYTYDSEDNRSTKRLKNATGEQLLYYYYDTNGDLVSVAQQEGNDLVENLMNYYRDGNGRLINFEYKGIIYDYVFNQRGDVVAITNELQEEVATYRYDAWGNITSIEGSTDLGNEIAHANPYRYVGQYSVHYDQDTNLYFMGWRDYDSTTGRFIVADAYEGDETNPISFNGYLYAEADPVNNIDPDGYAPKWLKKLAKGIKKTAKATYNFVIGDDIKTLKSKKTKWYQKAFAAVSIASNFIPGGALVTKATKLAIKGTVAVGKSIKAAKKVTKTVKAIKRTAKKASHVIKKKPKTPPASSIQSSKKLNHKPASPGKQMTPTKAPPKSNVEKTPERKTPQLRSEAVAGDNVGSKLSSGDKGAKGTDKAVHGNSKTSNKIQHGYEIFENDTGDVVKTGISGSKLNKNGTSRRANSQVNKWNKQVGFEKYQGRLVKTNIPNRQQAINWEMDNAIRLFDEGNSLIFHKRPRPWE